MINGRAIGAAKEADSRLLRRTESENVFQAAHRPGHFTAVESPGKRQPWPFLVLITEISSLLERLVMINAENALCHRRIEDQSPNLRSKVAGARVTYGRVRLEASQIWR